MWIQKKLAWILEISLELVGDDPFLPLFEMPEPDIQFGGGSPPRPLIPLEVNLLDPMYELKVTGKHLMNCSVLMGLSIDLHLNYRRMCKM